MLRVLEASGRVVQKGPGGFVQRRAQRAPSLSPPRGASGQHRSPGEPEAPGTGAGQGSAKGRGRSERSGGREAGRDSETTVPMYPGDTGDRGTGSREGGVTPVPSSRGGGVPK